MSRISSLFHFGFHHSKSIWLPFWDTFSTHFLVLDLPVLILSYKVEDNISWIVVQGQSVAFIVNTTSDLVVANPENRVSGQANLLNLQHWLLRMSRIFQFLVMLLSSLNYKGLQMALIHLPSDRQANKHKVLRVNNCCCGCCYWRLGHEIETGIRGNEWTNFWKLF